MLYNCEVQCLKPVFEVFTQLLHDVVICFCLPSHLNFVACLTVGVYAFKNTVHRFDAGTVDVNHGHLNFELALGCGGQLVDSGYNLTIKSRYIFGERLS